MARGSQIAGKVTRGRWSIRRPAVATVVGLMLAGIVAGPVMEVVPSAATTGPGTGPAPQVTSISPTSGRRAGGTVVTIIGTGFSPNATVKFGTRAAASVTYIDPTELKATTPASPIGRVGVTVTTTTGTSATTPADQFLFHIVPTITRIEPASIPYSGGYTVTLRGSNFTPTSTVTFGGEPGTTVVYGGVTKVSVKTPAMASPGLYTVTITTVTPTRTPPQVTSLDFAYPLYGAISSLTPNFGGASGGGTVTVRGSGFGATTTVTFGGHPGTTVHVTSSTSLTVLAPARSVPSGSVLKFLHAEGIQLKQSRVLDLG